jgi:hypothetical protein
MKLVVAERDDKKRLQLVRQLIDLGYGVDGNFDNASEAVEFARIKKPDAVILSCKLFHNATVNELNRIGIPAVSFSEVDMDVILSDLRSELMCREFISATDSKIRDVIANQWRILFGLLVGVSFAATIVLLLIRR